MNAKFLSVTDRSTKKPVIVGVTNIALIEPAQEGAAITLNFARGSDLWPRKFNTEENFESISKAVQGLTVDLRKNDGSDF